MFTESSRSLSRRIGVSLLGLMLCGVGIALFLHTGMGVDPASVLELGISHTVNVSYGTAAALLNIFILSLVFIIDRRYIHLSSFIAIFAIGYTADGVNFLISILSQGESTLWEKLLMLLLGLLIMSVGIATYIIADLGVGAIDLVAEIISDKMHLSYRLVRITSDASFVIIGYLLGGTVGIGTLIAVSLTGPTVHGVRPYVKRLLEPMLYNSR